jgi:uncharacterized protein
MEFNVAQLLKEPVGATRVYQLSEGQESIEDVPAVKPYIGSVKLTRINEGILADVKVDTRVRLSCSRCLADTELPLSLRFTEEYRPTVDLGSGAAVRVHSEEDKFTLDESHTLDLTEAVRQYALTAIPLSPLCREDCAGLCPVCGKDRNASPHDHRSEPTDPRLEVLGKLLEDDERS